MSKQNQVHKQAAKSEIYDIHIHGETIKRITAQCLRILRNGH